MSYDISSPFKNMCYVKFLIKYENLGTYQVYVIAHASLFNTEGMNIEQGKLINKNPDPIAVMKVDQGYVILAKW